MKKIVFALFILSSIIAQAQDENYNDTLRINEIQTLGSHNSYKIMTEMDLKWMKTQH